jgi:carbamate kinase
LSFLTLFEIIVIITGVLVLSPTRSMGHKIQAGVELVELGGKRAVVCRPEGVVKALEGRGGTVVER